jgi:hypothetical protein
VELALVARQLWDRKRLLLVGVVISALAAGYALYDVNSLLPPKFRARSLQYSAASTTAFVDFPHSLVGDNAPSLEPLVERATVYANLMASPGIVRLIGRYARIPGDQIWAAGPIDTFLQRVVVEPTAQKRNVQIAGEALPYRLNFYADPNLPTIDVYSQAPSNDQAVALANAAIQALSTYVQQSQDNRRIPAVNRVLIRQVGQPFARVVDGGIRKKLGGLVFVAAFIGWSVLVLIGIRARAYWRAAGLISSRIGSRSDLDDWPVTASDDVIEPEPATS